MRKENLKALPTGKIVLNETKYNKLKMIGHGYNRDLTNAHVKNVMKNINDMNYIGVIIALSTKAFGKKELVIGDGQNRWIASQRLNVPFNYMVYELEEDTPENVTKFIARMNSGQKAWSTNNFLDAFVANGKPSYMKFQTLMRETGLTITDMLNIYLGGAGVEENRKFKSGVMEFMNEKGSDRILEAVMVVKKVVPNKAYVRRKLIKKFTLCPDKDLFEFANEIKFAGESLIAGQGGFSENEKEFEDHIDRIYKNMKNKLKAA